MIDCSICLERLCYDERRLECGHMFHNRCISEWFNRNATCPLCRGSSISVTVIASPRLVYHPITTTTLRSSQSIWFKVIAGSICFLIFLAAAVPLYMLTH